MKRKTLIASLIASIVIIGGVVVGSILIPKSKEAQINLYVVETNTNTGTNGGQAVLVKGKKANILIDTGSTYYSETLTLDKVYNTFNNEIDTLILTSLAEEYNGGLMKFFTSQRYSIPQVKNLYYPGYKVDNDTSKYLEETLIPKLKQSGTNVCTASDVINGVTTCQGLFDISENYEVQILNTGYYTTEEITNDDINLHNMVVSINGKTNDFHFIFDGGLTDVSLKSFNSYYPGLVNKVDAWLLSNQKIDPYMNCEYYLGFKPKTTVFTASSYGHTRPSIYNRLSSEQFKTLLNISRKNIYTTLTMGTINIGITKKGKMSFKGSEVTMYKALNNTENERFIYSDLVRNNQNFSNIVKEVLGIDVSY